MNSLLKNKKGIEKVMSVFWFSVIIIIAFGIFVMIYNFYNYPYDVREVEVDLLKNKVVNCLVDSGQLNSYVLEPDFSDKFLEICEISFNVENEHGWKNNSEYYIGIEISNSSGFNKEIEKGNKNLISSCGEASTVEEEKLAKCSSGEFLSLYGEGIYSIKLLSIVRKTEKNVRY